MKTFNSLLLFVTVVFVLAQSAVAADVDFSPTSPKVGEKVGFSYTPDSTPIEMMWDFGDGSKPQDTGGTTTNNHTYKKGGTYTVRVWDRFYLPNGEVIFDITVGGTKKITYQPTKPRAGQKITFTAKDFDSTSCIRWEFGDGDRENDRRTPSSIVHSYEKNGTYRLKAYDECDTNTDPITKTVVVGGDTRRASFTPMEPKVNQMVTIMTRGNYDGCIKYDFGDGTQRSGRSSITHKYRKPGTYTVKIYSYCGDDPNPQTLEIVVVKGFTIDRLELRYEDASIPSENRFTELSPSVEQNTKKFRATARIKYSNAGMITMQWLVDNKVLQMITKRVNKMDGRLEIGTGVDLPTFKLGVHNVTVRFLSPRGVDFRIPILSYFVIPVAPPTEETAQDDVSITLQSITNELGSQVAQDPLYLSPGEYGVFDGFVNNNGAADFRNGQLQVLLDDSLVDSQVLLNIPAGGQKSFQASLKMTEKGGVVEFVVLDNSGQTIATSQIMVQPAVSP